MQESVKKTLRAYNALNSKEREEFEALLKVLKDGKQTFQLDEIKRGLDLGPLATIGRCPSCGR